MVFILIEVGGHFNGIRSMRLRSGFSMVRRFRIGYVKRENYDENNDKQVFGS